MFPAKCSCTLPQISWLQHLLSDDVAGDQKADLQHDMSDPLGSFAYGHSDVVNGQSVVWVLLLPDCTCAD